MMLYTFKTVAGVVLTVSIVDKALISLLNQQTAWMSYDVLASSPVIVNSTGLDLDAVLRLYQVDVPFFRYRTPFSVYPVPMASTLTTML